MVTIEHIYEYILKLTYIGQSKFTMIMKNNVLYFKQIYKYPDIHLDKCLFEIKISDEKSKVIFVKLLSNSQVEEELNLGIEEFQKHIILYFLEIGVPISINSFGVKMCNWKNMWYFYKNVPN